MAAWVRTKENWLALFMTLLVVPVAGCVGTPGNGSTATPAVPTGLAAVPGKAQIILSWNASTGATSYVVKRATSSGGAYNQIASAAATGYSDASIVTGNSYFYVVSAINPAGASPNSAPVSAKVTASTPPPTEPAPTPPPPAPAVTSVAVSPLSASTTTSGTLAFSATVQGTASDKSVTWSASSGSIISSGVYTAPKNSGTATITATSNADATKFASVSVTVTAPTTPAPTPPPPAPAPKSSPALTTGFFGLSWSATQASHFPTVPFSGMRAWDTNTSWDQIETSQGNYNWAMLDVWLAMASSHGKDLMYTFGFVPHWASMRPSEACAYMVSDPGCAAPPSDVDSGDNLWKAFVTALVNHSLSSVDLHIAYYELWNEPDLQRDWTGTPAQLATMAADAYAIIHKLDPSARVVGPAPSTANQYGVHFLPAYYAAGGAAAQDIVGMHAYLYDGSAYSSSPAGITLTISQLEALMSTYGISSKPIWFTEGNWGDVNNTAMSASQKVAYLAQEYLLMWSSGKVARYYWYAWDNTVYGTLWSPTSGINAAGIAYGRLTDWLVGSVHLDQPCSQASDGTWSCTLTLASGYPGEIIWNASTSKTISVSPSFATYETLADSKVLAIQGNAVAIGIEPILLVGSQVTQ